MWNRELPQVTEAQFRLPGTPNLLRVTLTEERKPSGRDGRSCWIALALLAKEQLCDEWHMPFALGVVLWGDWLFPPVEGLLCAKHSNPLSRLES